MMKEYDFSRLRFKKNPYAARLKRLISIRLDADVLDYFRQLAEVSGISYQTLINSYLRDCAAKKRKPVTQWT